MIRSKGQQIVTNYFNVINPVLHALTLVNIHCPAWCVHVLHMTFEINNGCFPKPHYIFGLYNGNGLCTL
jgi:hypothetical protein